MPLPQEDHRRLARLRSLLDGVEGRGVSRSAAPLEELPRLYRHACTVLARLETHAEEPRTREETAALVTRAHALLFGALGAARPNALARALQLLLVVSPRAIRAEWRLLAASFVVFYGLAIAAFVSVSADLDLAYSLLDPAVVEGEIAALEATPSGEPFRGNFDFGLGESPQAAGWILIHNMGVGILFFASALVPPLYLFMLLMNALMVGTYTAVAGHWDQAGSISSILWCHGTIELQTILLAGTAGAVLARAFLAPGPWSRRHALQIESQRAWHILAPVFPLLFLSGMIEGYVSPHAPPGVRHTVAVISGAALVLWALLGGRRRTLSPVDGPPATPPAAARQPPPAAR